MRTYWLFAPVLALLFAAGGVHAQQNYPTRPIRLIVPFPPGGPSDVVARMLAQKLAEAFKQSVVVDNRAGGGGTIGTETAVRADPDGHTMIIVSAAYTANAALYKLPYDPVVDVAPIALIGEAGNLVALHPSVPVKSIKELIAYDKANVIKLNYGSGGTGGDTHLAPELFNQMAGTKMTHVPYKGTGPALNELLGGQIHLMFGNLSVMVPHVKSNRLRGIAVTTAKRSNVLPDTPTVADTIAGYEAVTWAAVLGPKALHKDIVALWRREIDRIVQMPDVRERLAGNGMETVGGSPERVRKVLERDVAKWQKVVAMAGIKPGSDFFFGSSERYVVGTHGGLPVPCRHWTGVDHGKRNRNTPASDVAVSSHPHVVSRTHPNARSKTMARIQHLAIASQDPEKQAEFYKKVFGFEEIRRIDNPRARGVVLTDGAINISVLSFKQDQIDHGLDFTGLHHFGVYVDDLEGTAEKCLANGAVPYDELPEDPNEKKTNYRPKRSDKFKGPENCLFDIADHPWIGAGAVKEVAK